MHSHIRKKSIHERREKYPSSDSRIKYLDDLVMMIAFIMPLMTIPQIYTIWIEGMAEGVSVITWAMYGILSIPMVIYGIVHKDKPIMLMYFLWIIVDSLVVIGTFVF